MYKNGIPEIDGHNYTFYGAERMKTYVHDIGI